MFRIVEIIKEKGEQTDTITTSQTSSNNPCCEHQNLLVNMKSLLKEKEELNNSVIELKNQLAEMEIKQHAAEKAKEPKPMKNQEVVACLVVPPRSEIESTDEELAFSLGHKQVSTNGSLQLKEGMTFVGQCDCQSELDKVTAEAEKLKREVELAENDYNILEEKLTAAQAELVHLKTEKINWSRKFHSLEVKESQTQAELCEMSQLYEGLCELKFKDENNDALAALKMRFQKIKTENHEMTAKISKLQNDFQHIKLEKELLQECLNDSQNREIDLVKKLKRNSQTEHEHKEIQTSHDAEVVKQKLKSLVNLLDLEENKKEMLIKPFYQTANADAIVQHMKLFYNEFISTNNCKKDQEKKLKCFEKECTDLSKGKEKLEFRIQKLASICKAYQGLIEGQGKEVQQMKELKAKLEEKTQKCELLNKRLSEMEAILAKRKDRENAYKKKYFKERHVNRKKHKKKCNNWLSKIFDWRQAVIS
uniref:Uncharacterized protein n=1 Tax=Rhodnius prolixus TaxID=13249 RepID=T1HHX2_RHOPR